MFLMREATLQCTASQHVLRRANRRILGSEVPTRADGLASRDGPALCGPWQPEHEVKTRTASPPQQLYMTSYSGSLTSYSGSHGPPNGTSRSEISTCNLACWPREPLENAGAPNLVVLQMGICVVTFADFVTTLHQFRSLVPFLVETLTTPH